MQDRRALWTALWIDPDGDGVLNESAGCGSSDNSTDPADVFGGPSKPSGGAAGDTGNRPQANPVKKQPQKPAAPRRSVFGMTGLKLAKPKNVFSLASQMSHQSQTAMPLASSWLNGALLGRWDNVTGPCVELSWRCSRAKKTVKKADENVESCSSTEQGAENTGSSEAGEDVSLVKEAFASHGVSQSSQSTDGEKKGEAASSNRDEKKVDDDDDSEPEESEQERETKEALITHHVIAGTLEDNLAVKMVVLPHMKSVLCSVAFACELPDDRPNTPSRLSFALHADHKFLERIVAAFPVIEEKLLYIANLVRAIAAPSLDQIQHQMKCIEAITKQGITPPGPKETIEMLSIEIVHVLQALDDVVCNPGLGIPVNDPEINLGVRDTEDFGKKLYGAASVFGIDFMSRVITSHLNTRGYTVIIAKDPFVANVFVDILAPFLSPKDKLLSRYAKSTTESSDSSAGGPKCHCHSLFNPDLVLQAVVIPPEVIRAAPTAGKPSRRRARLSVGLQVVDTEMLVQSPVPLTVVDLTCFDGPEDKASMAPEGESSEDSVLLSPASNSVNPPVEEHSLLPNVYQPVSVGAFSMARTSYFKYRMNHLPEFVFAASVSEDQWMSSPSNPQPSPQPTMELTGSMRQIPSDSQAAAVAAAIGPAQGNEPFLTPVQECSCIIHDSLCEALGMPAMLRLPYMMSVNRLLLLKGVTLLKLVQSDLETNHGSTELTGKWLRDNLGLRSETDLNVVFSFAEKISPGVCASIMADRLVLEERFIELFEGFV